MGSESMRAWPQVRSLRTSSRNDSSRVAISIMPAKLGADYRSSLEIGWKAVDQNQNKSR
jgi:hypothetical protein